ncbi:MULTISPECIES: hypothetical protein [unclassified Burkholderia]|uniref:hypothetical protein n=1 Tax=unclassified Burkholderia TaxID=2613784 RepID=UPI0014219C18|nr:MULTISPECIES: hypothetical protein [unclassified Burkholderia]
MTVIPLVGWPPSGSASGALVVYDATHMRTDVPFADVLRLPARRVKAGTSRLPQPRVSFEFDDNEAG